PESVRCFDLGSHRCFKTWPTIFSAKSREFSRSCLKQPFFTPDPSMTVSVPQLGRGVIAWRLYMDDGPGGLISTGDERKINLTFGAVTLSRPGLLSLSSIDTYIAAISVLMRSSYADP